MVSALAVNKTLANKSIAVWLHDPGTTDATICSPDGGTTLGYADLGLFGGLTAICSPITFGAASGVTKVELVASADAAFTSPIVIKDSGTIAADQLGDWYALECLASELAGLGDGLRYAAARVTCSNAGDAALVVYIATNPRYAHGGLTASDNIA